MGTRNGVHGSVGDRAGGLVGLLGRALIEARGVTLRRCCRDPNRWQPDWMSWVGCRIMDAWLDVLGTAKTPSNEIVLPLV